MPVPVKVSEDTSVSIPEESSVEDMEAEGFTTVVMTKRSNGQYTTSSLEKKKVLERVKMAKMPMKFYEEFQQA